MIVKETNSLPSIPMLIAYWIINVRNIKERIKTFRSGPVRSGPVWFSPVYLAVPIYKSHQAFRPADYLVLSGALGKPCTRVIYR
jgi:hypothetical protein